MVEAVVAAKLARSDGVVCPCRVQLLAYQFARPEAKSMPTIPGIPGLYRFFFYSFDCNEPKHVHVRRERKVCKFWLESIALSSNSGFSAKELNRIRAIIRDNVEHMLETWDEHCGE